MNYVSGLSLLVKDLKKFFRKKAWLLKNAKKNNLQVGDGYGAGAGAVFQIYGSFTEQKPKKLFSAPQYRVQT
jgi:hypothetical protein